ncbi:MAG: hypothetical protein ACE3L7_05625 [Candidatus Pristimantibacillus sp.]
MSATWLWQGDYEGMERVSTAPEASGSIGSWSEVKPEDAVFVLEESRMIELWRFPNATVFNAGVAAASIMSITEKLRKWSRAGLTRSALEDERLYRVSVVHLELVELMRINSRGQPLGKGKAILRLDAGMIEHDELLWPDDPVLRRVVRTAVSALYAIGLDMGEADIALCGDGGTAVRDARSIQDESLRMMALRRFAVWHTLIQADAEAMEGKKLLIGADPEFVLLRPDGKIAPASRFLGEGVNNAAGSDAMLIGKRIVYPVAELRPEPAADPTTLARHVQRLLHRAAAKIDDASLRWAAGAMPVPGLALGGHIHLSGTPLSSRLLRLLDSYMAFPLALVEDPAGRGRRPRYGALGDFRRQPHGGFEYRTLPSWLVSPAAAKAIFALALLCAREARTLSYIPALDERYVEAFYAGDRAELAGCLDHVAASAAATPSYAALEPYIEPLLDAARRGATWDERADIRIKWRIPRP